MTATVQGNQLVLVTYYLKSYAEVDALVAQFEAAIGLRYAHVLIVDNGGAIADASPVEGRMRCVRGSNRFYEFSGWLEGLEALGPQEGGIVTLLNDSFGRNWNITRASAPILAAMIADAKAGRIAGFLDNFFPFSRPYFSRRPNSRLVLLPPDQLGVFARSLAAAIALCERRIAGGEPLFDAETQARLDRWKNSQPGRWSEAALVTRDKRIFVEHHLFDAVPAELLSMRPRHVIGSLAYAVAKRFYKEAR
ncbi:MAG: hypothetical protein C0500_12165 [Sphingobium sp.]|nr:hypothetical protein [Sphingobium sp.]